MSRVEELQLSEICLSLESPEKYKRVNALEKFRNIITNGGKEWTKSELLEMWQIVNKYIAKHLKDSSESCRNLSIEIAKTFVEKLPVFEKNIIYLMPVLTRRLGTQEILESSEEVRLNSIILIQMIIKVYQEHLVIYIDDLIKILEKTVVDNYPKVKRESCRAISDLARSIPAQFYSKSETIIKPILSNFTHQHYRVRMASVQAIGDVLQYGNSKSMGDVAIAMAQRLFDQSGAVRAAVIEVAGNWLLNLRDRYSWWFKLIPLLLTGLHDEIEEIRLKSAKLWDDVGKKYLIENECDEKIKDKMDFLAADLEHYPNVERPNLGCRLIVQQNVGKLVVGISNELDDWIADIRVRSAQLLAVLTLNSEQDITQHIEKLLPSMYRACIDEDNRVTVNVITAAEYIGYFVPPQTYCRLVLPTLEDVNIHSGHLAVLSGLFRGSERTALSEQLETIGNFLQQSYICRSNKAKYQEELLKCCEALITISQEDCTVIARHMFTIIFTVWAMAKSEQIENSARRLTRELAKLADAEDSQALYAIHLPWLLKEINNTASAWHIHSPEFCIFKLSLSEGKVAALNNIDIVSSILRKTMSEKADSELKLKLFIILSELFQCRDKYLTQLKDMNEFLANFLKEILMPSLIWKAGKSAEALRTATVGCLCALLDESENQNEIIQLKSGGEAIFSDKKLFTSIFGELRPILISLIDDNSRKTRLFTLRAIYLFIHHGQKICCITEEDVIGIYPSILKRLDDGCDDVRSAAVETLVFLWKALPKNYDVDFGRNHLDYLYTSTIVHLDDPEESFQNLMLDAMMELAAVHPAMLANKIENCMANFRNQKGLKCVLKQCYDLLKEKEN